ncbi:MAG: transketolase [SAR324 cluster bacterium]|nr:transketolase [SAR324 cluster bacterium]
MRDAFVEELLAFLKRDAQVMLLTADLGFGIFDEIAAQCPGQFFNVGVAEQNMVGIATGLALEGRKVFTYSIANFAFLRCMEQIRNDACYHDLNINIAASGGGFSYGALGMSHHATEDLSILRSLPGITLVAPGTVWEMRQAVPALLAAPGVSYLRIDKSHAEDSAAGAVPYTLGKARRLREGTDVTLIATGGILREALLAAEALAKERIECRVLSMHTVKPLDEHEVLAAARETRGIVTVEENTVLGGLGSAVAETCLEAGTSPGFFRRIGMADTYATVVGSQTYLKQIYGMDAAAIADTVRGQITSPASLRQIKK